MGRQYLNHNRCLTNVCKMKDESLEQYDFIQSLKFKLSLNAATTSCMLFFITRLSGL